MYIIGEFYANLRDGFEACLRVSENRIIYEWYVYIYMKYNEDLNVIQEINNKISKIKAQVGEEIATSTLS